MKSGQTDIPRRFSPAIQAFESWGTTTSRNDRCPALVVLVHALRAFRRGSSSFSAVPTKSSIALTGWRRRTRMSSWRMQCAALMAPAIAGGRPPRNKPRTWRPRPSSAASSRSIGRVAADQPATPRQAPSVRRHSRARSRRSAESARPSRSATGISRQPNKATKDDARKRCTGQTAHRGESRTC